MPSGLPGIAPFAISGRPWFPSPIDSAATAWNGVRLPAENENGILIGGAGLARSSRVQNQVAASAGPASVIEWESRSIRGSRTKTTQAEKPDPHPDHAQEDPALRIQATHPVCQLEEQMSHGVSPQSHVHPMHGGPERVAHTNLGHVCSQGWLYRGRLERTHEIGVSCRPRRWSPGATCEPLEREYN